jgi:hypothetical protein
MLRVIYYAILFYVFYKIITYLLRLFSASSKRNEDEPKNVQQNEPQNKKRYNIEQKDIVEASFEEIKEEKKEQAQ